MEDQLGNNDLLELERQRGFVERQTQGPDEEDLEDNNDSENEYYVQFGVECDEVLGEDDCIEYDTSQ